MYKIYTSIKSFNIIRNWYKTYAAQYIIKTKTYTYNQYKTYAKARLMTRSYVIKFKIYFFLKSFNFQ